MFLGTWGVGIFEDDIASDIRDQYLDSIGDGYSSVDASEVIISSWQNHLDNPDIFPIFWLSLSLAQWECGRLQDDVKEKAIEIIDQNIDLKRWKGNPNQLSKRKVVLSKLKEKLESPQPLEKKIEKRFVNHTDWKRGDVIAYRLKSGKKILIRVIGTHTDRGGTSPVVEILAWIGHKIPSKRRIRKMSFITGSHFDMKISQLLLGRLRENELPVERIELVAHNVKPKQKLANYSAIVWSYLDKYLKRLFDLE